LILASRNAREPSTWAMLLAALAGNRLLRAKGLQPAQPLETSF